MNRIAPAGQQDASLRQRRLFEEALGAPFTEGNRIEREASDFHARVVQHECDHLDGILYPMRMTDFGLMGFNEEIARFSDQPGAAPPPARG